MDGARSFLPPHEVEVVIYHSPCHDGFGAAFVAWLWNSNLRFVPLSYGKGLKDHEEFRGKNVLMVDCSLPREDFLALRNTTRKVLLLDHHVSAHKDLGDLDGCYFDLERSGVRLAWDYFPTAGAMPRFLEYIEDKDLWWRRNLPRSKEFMAAFEELVPFDFDAYLQFLSPAKILEYITKGEGLLEYKNTCVQNDAKKAVAAMTLFYGREMRVKLLNSGHRHVNELGELLSADCDFAALWIYDHHAGHFSISLRSQAGGFDVSEFAKSYGGGGHQASAGFTWKGNSIFDVFVVPNKARN